MTVRGQERTCPGHRHEDNWGSHCPGFVNSDLREFTEAFGCVTGSRTLKWDRLDEENWKSFLNFNIL